MELLSTETLNIIATFFKVFYLFAAGLMVVVSYFQMKEAQKMENKLQIALPGSVDFAMSAQLIFSILFLFSSVIVFFLF
ncbi:MAG: hypothetical protein Q7T54_02005 [Candidatus Levybacteria bacterium]|nr:hypothetical protein [Candidatus Levybacteria bacterium]